MTAFRPDPGASVRLQWRKWDGGPHWRNECVFLGSDSWGEWLGQPEGFDNSRPAEAAAGAAQFDSGTDAVVLVPPTGDWVLTVHRRPRAVRIYIDLAWDVRWAADGTEIHGIDMDLDVVRVLDDTRGTWVDDRDEWEEHSARYGYPASVMAHLEPLAAELETQVRERRAPFDDATAEAWFTRLDGVRPAH